MRRIASKDTSPELLIRKLTHRLGYRFRIHRKDLPGKPDLAFLSKKKVIFVHGCFWHQHRDPQCKISHTPKSRTDYWIPKLQRNAERDKEHQEKLNEKGWEFLIVWECQVKDLKALSARITSFVG